MGKMRKMKVVASAYLARCMDALLGLGGFFAQLTLFELVADLDATLNMRSTIFQQDTRMPRYGELTQSLRKFSSTGLVDR